MCNIHDSDVVWKDLTVEVMDRAEFEAFLNRNQIPFRNRSAENGQQVYLIREGIDYIDSSIYALKRWGNLKDADTVNDINELVLQRDFTEVRYDYECYGWHRSEEDVPVLGRYVGLKAD